jgi:hypothetical protein
MADCLDGIGQDIQNLCADTPTGGLEINAWVFNRTELSGTVDPTNKNLYTALSVIVTKKGYRLTGFKKNMDAGSDVVVADDSPDKYTHFFALQAWLQDALATNGLDNLSDLVVVVEGLNKMNDGDGAFVMYGFDFGLYKSTDTRRFNTLNGNRSIELTSLAGQEEAVSQHIVFDTDEATTRDMLDALLITQV